MCALVVTKIQDQDSFSEDIVTRRVFLKCDDGNVLIAQYSVNQYKGLDKITASQVDQNDRPIPDTGCILKEENGKEILSWAIGDVIEKSTL